MPQFQLYPEVISSADDDLFILRQAASATVKTIKKSNLSLSLLSGNVINLINIASLKAYPLTGVATGASVSVSGYNTLSDGGGGIFTYDSASVAADNAGTIIAPNSGVGRWIRSYDDAINVKWFGAKGNGVTNDTNAIQGAATYITSIGGGGLYLPSGNYLVSAEIAFGEKVNVFGDGIVATTVTGSHDGAILHFSEDHFQLEGLSINGPANPAFTNSIGLRCSVRMAPTKVGAQNYSVWNVLVNYCYIGCSFEGSANSLLMGVRTGNCYNIGIRCRGAQGKWHSLNVATSFSHGLLIEAHPTPALSMASPFLSNVETFANGGFGIKVTTGMGLQLTNGFINNDSDGGIWFDTNSLAQVGQLSNIIIQYTGNNPFDPRNDPTNPFTGDKDAPGIRLGAGGAATVIINNMSTFNNAGNDIESTGFCILSGAALEAAGQGIPVRGAFPAIPPSATSVFALRFTGGFNSASAFFTTAPVYIAGNYNRLANGHISGNSATVPAFDVAAASINNNFCGVTAFQNNGGGISIRTNATSTYFAGSMAGLGGVTSIAGTYLASTLI